jgi:hypothetical protein
MYLPESNPSIPFLKPTIVKPQSETRQIPRARESPHYLESVQACVLKGALKGRP